MLKKELQKFFAPEFLNRIDEVVIFKNLNREDVKKIVFLEVDRLQKRLTGLKYNFTFDESVIDLIAEVGYDDIYGARPLKRAIQDKIEDYISEEVLKGSLVENGVYNLVVVDKEIKIEEQKPVKRGRKKKGAE